MLLSSSWGAPEAASFVDDCATSAPSDAVVGRVAHGAPAYHTRRRNRGGTRAVVFHLGVPGAVVVPRGGPAQPSPGRRSGKTAPGARRPAAWAADSGVSRATS